MDLVSALFQIARNISDGNNDQLNKLEEKAKGQVEKYHTESENKIHQMYAKFHNGWFFQLALYFLVPFVSVWIIKEKNKILSNESPDYDEHDREYFEDMGGHYDEDINDF